MKKIILSLFILFFGIVNETKAQLPQFTITPVIQCYNPISVYNFSAGITVTPNLPSLSYTWAISALNPTSACLPATLNLVPGVGSLITGTNTCCGIFQVFCNIYTGTNVATTLTNTYEIVCPAGASITVVGTNSNSALCTGSSATLTGNGAISYTWYASSCGSASAQIGGGTNIVVTPTCNSTYTLVGLTAQGCPVTATTAIIVQSATMTASPASPSLCLGAPITFSATSAVQTSSLFSPGTVTTGIAWFNPTPTQIGSTNNVATTAAGGVYSVNLVHVGSAGTCTLTKTATLNLLTTIPVTINPTPLSGSVCPGNTISLIANSSQTAAASYSWNVSTFPTTVNGAKTVTRTIFGTTNFTVNVNYYGCTGSQTFVVGTLTLNPTLTASSPSSCPGKSITLTAGGGLTYTFSGGTQACGGSTFALTTSTAGNSATNAPSAAQLTCPVIYTVKTSSLGCTGSATLAVGLLVMNLSVTPSSYPNYSVCPNRTLALIPHSGAGTTYTFYSVNYNTTFSAGVTGSVSHNPGTVLNFPHIYDISSDSAGCKGNTQITMDILTLNTSLTATSYSICPGKSVSLQASNGSGTSYTFFAPYSTGQPSNVIPKGSPTTSAISNFSTPVSPSFPYQYTVTADSVGCVGTATLDINLLALSPTLTSSSPSVCVNSSFALNVNAGAGTNYTFTAPPSIKTCTGTSASGTFITCAHTPTILPSTYTVVLDSAGCLGSSTHTIYSLGLTQNLTLTALGTNNFSACPGGNFTLQANSGSSGSTFSFQQLPSTPIPTITANTASTSAAAFPATFQVQSDSSGCTGTQTLIIQRMYLNRLVLNATNTFVCANNTLALMPSGVGNATSNIIFTVAVVNGTTISNPSIITSPPSPTIIVTPTVNPTVYIFTADSAGCIAYTNPPNPFQTVTVNIKPGLTFTPVASPSLVCSGLPSTISVAGPSNNINYTWTAPSPNPGTLTPSSGQATSAVANPTATSTYTINGSDPGGCIGQTVVTIGIDPTASLVVSLAASATTVCPGQSVSLTASVSLPTATVAWTPTNVLGTGPYSGTAISSPSLISTTIFQAVANNGYGCIGVKNITITLNSFPNLTANANPPQVCPGFASTITGLGAQSYTWIGNSTSFSGAVSQVSISAGPGVYTVIGSNGGGCTIQAIKTISVAPNFTPGITVSSQTTCVDQNFPKQSKPVLLTASGGNNYVWSPYDSGEMTFSVGPQTNVTPSATKTYTLYATTSACSGSALVTVAVIPQFTMSVIPPLPAMCIGDSLKLNIAVISTAAIGPASAFTYSWTDPQKISMAPSAGLTSSVYVFPLSTDTYTVDMKDSRACVSLPRLITVTVLPRPDNSVAIPTINTVATNTLCHVGSRPGATDILLELAAINRNNNLPFGVVPTFTWVGPYGKYNSFLVSNYNSTMKISAPIKLPAVVTYTLKSGYNGVGGCADVDTVSVRIIDCRPVGQFTFNTLEKLDTLCARGCITFTNLADTASGGPQTYTWSFPGGSPAVSNDKDPTVCYNLPGKYDVFLRVNNPYPKNPVNGSPGSSGIIGADRVIKVVDVPNVTIFSPGQYHNDSTIRFGQKIEINGSGAYRYAWSPSYNITSLTDPKVTVNPFRTTQYILTGYNSKDCYSTDTLNVFVIEDCGEMFVPNAFTPNDDKANDVLFVRGICLESISFMVFNRWGEKIFETTDQSVGWDGTFKGEKLNSGIYVFRLEGKTYDGKGYSLKGNVTLIR